MKPPPRVVLDTNVVLSSLLFAGGPPARVRLGWREGRFIPLASAATTTELVRVLAYPKFGLSAPECEELLADYLPWVRVVRVLRAPPNAPMCRDPFDAAFIHLALAGKAQVLVSGDKDLLALAGTMSSCAVLGVDPFCRQYLDD